MQVGKIGFVPLQPYNRTKNIPSFKANLSEMEGFKDIEFGRPGYNSDRQSINASIYKNDCINGLNIETLLEQGKTAILFLKDKNEFKIVRFDQITAFAKKYNPSSENKNWSYVILFTEIFPQKDEKIAFGVDMDKGKIVAENVEIFTKKSFEPWAEKNILDPLMIIKLSKLIDDVHDTMS